VLGDRFVLTAELQLHRIIHTFIVVVFFRADFKQFFLVVIHFYAPFSVFYSMGRDCYRLMTENWRQIIDTTQDLDS
jgi:hypothetical protein